VVFVEQRARLSRHFLYLKIGWEIDAKRENGDDEGDDEEEEEHAQHFATHTYPLALVPSQFVVVCALACTRLSVLLSVVEVSHQPSKNLGIVRMKLKPHISALMNKSLQT